MTYSPKAHGKLYCQIHGLDFSQVFLLCFTMLLTALSKKTFDVRELCFFELH